MKWSSVAQLALVIGAAGPGGAGPTEQGSRAAVSARIGAVVTEGNSVARVRLSLERAREPKVDPYAEWISVGPLGAGVREPPARGQDTFFVLEPPRRLLRVTISTSERTQWLTIDDILNGHAGSRSLKAQYRISPYFDEHMRDAWNALVSAPRVLGADPNPPIAWLSPTTFAWLARSDTLIFEQVADSIFVVTVRARVR